MEDVADRSRAPALMERITSTVRPLIDEREHGAGLMSASEASQSEKTDSVRAVGRALEILLSFAPNDTELSATELLKRVRLSRPTLYRLLYTLEEHGFIVSVGDPQRFRLGPSVARLAQVCSPRLNLPTVAEPFMRDIWAETDETVALFARRDSMRVCVAEILSPQPLNFKRGVGYSELMVRGASGRAILAHMDLGLDDLRRWTEGTEIDVCELQADVAKIRKRGYATSHNKLIQGAIAVATPFFDQHGEAAGSIAVFGPDVRLSASRQRQIAALLQDSAGALSRALRHQT